MELDTSTYMNVPRQSPRSISPISPSRSEGHPQQSHRPSLLSSVAKRIGRKSSQACRSDYHPDNDSGCSTDSCSSAEANLSSNYSSILSNSTSQTDSSSNNYEENLSSSSTEEHMKMPKNLSVRFRSTSSLRRALKSLSISTRSLSCTGSRERSEPFGEDTEDNYDYEKRVHFKTGPSESSALSKVNKRSSNLISQRSKTPPPQRRILRQPVSYLYLKGMSGLPTQRVPRSSVCCPQGYRW